MLDTDVTRRPAFASDEDDVGLFLSRDRPDDAPDRSRRCVPVDEFVLDGRLRRLLPDEPADLLDDHARVERFVFVQPPTLRTVVVVPGDDRHCDDVP